MGAVLSVFCGLIAWAISRAFAKGTRGGGDGLEMLCAEKLQENHLMKNLPY